MSDILKGIVKDQQLKKSMDFNSLRKEAIANTQKISGDNWTDYNIHDPGVTIMEQFCYVLTDIAYRTNLPIETLLFHKGNVAEVMKSNALYPKEAILPTAPITLSDYRILILDHFPDKLSNCWIDTLKDHREGIQGLYNITLLVKSDIREEDYQAVKSEVQRLFVAHRNLGEDLNEISILRPEKIAFSASIDIRQDEDPEEILTEILFRIEQYFNPSIHFYTLEELENKGWNINRIFETPSFKHGFITYDQLKPKPKEFYVSKIADLILDVSGVRGLRNLMVFQDGIPVLGDIIRVDDDKFLTLGLLLNPEEEDGFRNFDITLYKGGALNNYMKSAILHGLEVKEARTHRNYELKTKSKEKSKLPIKTAELIGYESIQKNFPGIYGVGDYTPAKEEGELRVAQSNQLKAYLMFFDQIMANHLAQLSRLSDIFSIDNVDPTQISTYYSQVLGENISAAHELLKHRLAPKSDLERRLSELEKYKDNLDAKEKKEYHNLLRDLKQKKQVVNAQVEETFSSLLQLSEQGVYKVKKFQNRDILKKIVQIKRVIHQEEEPSQEVSERIAEVKELMRADLEEQTQEVDWEQHHLDFLLAGFDQAKERKNRLLSHLLARFGENFTTDFHIKFSSLMEGADQESIDNKLIKLKSIFLKELADINKKRFKGLDYLENEAILQTIPLKRKLSLLLDFALETEAKGGASLEDAVKVRKLTGADVERKPYLSSKNKSDKTTFLINSSSYFHYLFKYAIKEENYKIEKDEKQYNVVFTPPSKEAHTTLLSTKSKAEAQEKVNAIIRHFRALNVKSENFHIVDHILLRPRDNGTCHFTILGNTGKPIFRSKEAKPEEIQKKSALDVLLLGCYPNNFRILQNPEKEFVVLIKNSVGVDLAKSTESYITETGAQKFIEECVSHFINSKDRGGFDSIYELDNQKKYYFDIVNHKNELLFQSKEALSLSNQEKQIEDFAIFSLLSACYTVVPNSDETYSVAISNYEQTEIALSYQRFGNAAAAEEFIEECLLFFEEVSNANDYKSIVRYKRLDGRSANDINAQISVVYSAWTSRFDNEEFLQLFKQTLFHCAPAHISIQLVGLNYADMKHFEALYAQYLEELGRFSIENQDILTRLSNDLLNILTRKP